MIELKDRIKKHLKCNNQGKIKWLLGIQIPWDRKNRTIIIDQEMYIKTIWEHYSFADIKTVPTPIDSSVVLDKDFLNENVIFFIKDKPYWQTIEALINAAIRTRPDGSEKINLTIYNYLDYIVAIDSE